MFLQCKKDKTNTIKKPHICNKSVKIHDVKYTPNVWKFLNHVACLLIYEYMKNFSFFIILNKMFPKTWTTIVENAAKNTKGPFSFCSNEQDLHQNKKRTKIQCKQNTGKYNQLKVSPDSGKTVIDQMSQHVSTFCLSLWDYLWNIYMLVCFFIFIIVIDVLCYRIASFFRSAVLKMCVRGICVCCWRLFM